jgi:rhodanese-related sulfurtransferase
MRYPALLVVALLCFSSLLLVESAPAAVREIQADTLKQLLTSDSAKVFVLDVRTEREFAGGRLSGAKLVPMNDVPKRLGEIPKNRKIVVVCATGARSAAVARYLDEAGYPWVANLTGGIMNWMRAGLPVVR